MTNDSLAFWLDHCICIGVTSPIILSQPRLPAEKIIVRIEKDIIPYKMIKRGLKKDMTDFLQTPKRLSSKKRRQINKSKQKTCIGKTSSKKLLLVV